MKRNAFTLVEVLAVVVILGISFMFIITSLTSLVNKNEKTETKSRIGLIQFYYGWKEME